MAAEQHRSDDQTPDQNRRTERRHTETDSAPHKRRKQDFLTKYKQPVVGLGLVAAALPLVNAQANSQHQKPQPVEPPAEQTPASAEATAAAKTNDAEESLVAKIA